MQDYEDDDRDDLVNFGNRCECDMLQIQARPDRDDETEHPIG
jgi:hypothetical protein